MFSPEQLLDGFVPDFEFSPVDPLPSSEFETRLRRILREAVIGDYDGLIVNSEMIGWLRPSNHYLRYVCDWIREGVLIVPTDNVEASVLLSFYSDAALVPPPGEPTWVDDIRQVGGWGRQFFDRPGSTTAKLVEATKSAIADLGLDGGRFALIGDFVGIGRRIF